MPHLYRATQVVEQVKSVLLVPAGVEHSWGAGQLQESIDHALVLVGGDFHRLPHLRRFVIQLRGVAWKGEGGGREGGKGE